MTEAVLAASALLAFLRQEPGARAVSALLPRSCISAVNLAETISKMVEYGKPLEDIGRQIDRLQIPVIRFDAEHAKIVASMWKVSRLAGLSLGDRACLALGLHQRLPMLTSDQNWMKADLGVRVEPIR